MGHWRFREQCLQNQGDMNKQLLHPQPQIVSMMSTESEVGDFIKFEHFLCQLYTGDFKQKRGKVEFFPGLIWMAWRRGAGSRDLKLTETCTPAMKERLEKEARIFLEYFCNVINQGWCINGYKVEKVRVKK